MILLRLFYEITNHYRRKYPHPYQSRLYGGGRKIGSEYLVDIEAKADMLKSAQTGELADTVDSFKPNSASGNEN